jgi:hypothetical protein
MVVTRRPQSSAQGGDETPSTPVSGADMVDGSSYAQQTNGGSKGGKPAAKEQPIGEVVRDATPAWAYAILIAFTVISIVTFPIPFQPPDEPTLKHVFYYGWLTALSTGLGALPFVFLPDVASYWVGICNGMLLTCLQTKS